MDAREPVLHHRRARVTPLAAVAIFAAGLAAGTINTIVGSGSLITFPTLLAAGFPPVVANVTNTVGLVPGGASGVVGYRRELVGQRRRILGYGAASGLGGLTGGLLLLALPASVFAVVVPVLILFACGLVAFQPRITRLLAGRHAGMGAGQVERPALVRTAAFLTGIYGGYFGAAQGVILFALLSVLIDDDAQRLNGLKNVLVLIVNGVAAILFILVAPVDWAAAALIAIGSIIGGQLGAYVGRRLSPLVLRAAIVAVGLVVAAKLLILPG